MQSVATAYLAVAFGEFVAGFYPGLTAHAQKTGVAVLVFLAALNWVGLRMGSRAQELTSLVKAVGLLALVAACFIVSPKAPVTSPSLLSDSFALSWSVRSSNGFNQRPVGVILAILDSMVPA